MEKSKSYIKPILLAVLFAVLSLTTIIWGSGTLNSTSPDSQVYATGEVAYLLKDWQNIVTNYDSITSLTFTNTDPTSSGAVLYGADVANSSVSAVDAGSYSGDTFSQTKGVASGNADVIVYKDSSDENIVYIYSTGMIYFPADSSSLFYGCYFLTQINFGTDVIDTSNVTDMSQMFTDCINLTDLDLSGFNTSSLLNAGNIVGASDCEDVPQIKNINISGWDLSKCNDNHIFGNGYWGLRTINMSNVKFAPDMSGLFAGINYYNRLEWIDLSNVNTSLVTNMNNLFSYSLYNYNGSYDSTFSYEYNENYTNQYMLSLDLSYFDMSGCTTANSVENMFGNSSDFCILGELRSPRNVKTNITLPDKEFYKVTGDSSPYTIGEVTGFLTVSNSTSSCHLLQKVDEYTIYSNGGTWNNANGWTVDESDNTMIAKVALYNDKKIGTAPIINSGYHIESWNTAANSSGTRYELTDAIPTGTTLYAQFAEGELPVTGVDVGIGTLIASVLATLLLACGLVLVLNKKKRYK